MSMSCATASPCISRNTNSLVRLGAKLAETQMGPPARMLSFLAPVGERRSQLEPDEAVAEHKGRRQWFPPLIQTEATPIPSLMASPGREALLSGGFAGALGALAGHEFAQHSGGLHDTALTLTGGAAAALPFALRKYISRHHENAHLNEVMRRLPPHATKRDLDAADAVEARFENKYAALGAACGMAEKKSVQVRGRVRRPALRMQKKADGEADGEATPTAVPGEFAYGQPYHFGAPESTDNPYQAQLQRQFLKEQDERARFVASNPPANIQFHSPALPQFPTNDLTVDPNASVDARQRQMAVRRQRSVDLAAQHAAAIEAIHAFNQQNNGQPGFVPYDTKSLDLPDSSQLAEIAQPHGDAERQYLQANKAYDQAKDVATKANIPVKRLGVPDPGQAPPSGVPATSQPTQGARAVAPATSQPTQGARAVAPATSQPTQQTSGGPVSYSFPRSLVAGAQSAFANSPLMWPVQGYEHLGRVLSQGMQNKAQQIGAAPGQPYSGQGPPPTPLSPQEPPPPTLPTPLSPQEMVQFRQQLQQVRGDNVALGALAAQYQAQGRTMPGGGAVLPDWLPAQPGKGQITMVGSGDGNDKFMKNHGGPMGSPIGAQVNLYNDTDRNNAMIASGIPREAPTRAGELAQVQHADDTKTFNDPRWLNTPGNRALLNGGTVDPNSAGQSYQQQRMQENQRVQDAQATQALGRDTRRYDDQVAALPSGNAEWVGSYAPGSQRFIPAVTASGPRPVAPATPAPATPAVAMGQMARQQATAPATAVKTPATAIGQGARAAVPATSQPTQGARAAVPATSQPTQVAGPPVPAAALAAPVPPPQAPRPGMPAQPIASAGKVPQAPKMITQAADKFAAQRTCGHCGATMRGGWCPGCRQFSSGKETRRCDNCGNVLGHDGACERCKSASYALGAALGALCKVGGFEEFANVGGEVLGNVLREGEGEGEGVVNAAKSLGSAARVVNEGTDAANVASEVVHPPHLPVGDVSTPPPKTPPIPETPPKPPITPTGPGKPPPVAPPVAPPGAKVPWSNRAWNSPRGVGAAVGGLTAAGDPSLNDSNTSKTHRALNALGGAAYGYTAPVSADAYGAGYVGDFANQLITGRQSNWRDVGAAVGLLGAGVSPQEAGLGLTEGGRLAEAAPGATRVLGGAFPGTAAKVMPEVNAIAGSAGRLGASTAALTTGLVGGAQYLHEAARLGAGQGVQEKVVNMITQAGGDPQAAKDWATSVSLTTQGQTDPTTLLQQHPDLMTPDGKVDFAKINQKGQAATTAVIKPIVAQAMVNGLIQAGGDPQAAKDWATSVSLTTQGQTDPTTLLQQHPEYATSDGKNVDFDKIKQMGEAAATVALKPAVDRQVQAYLQTPAFMDAVKQRAPEIMEAFKPYLAEAGGMGNLGGLFNSLSKWGGQAGGLVDKILNMILPAGKVAGMSMIEKIITVIGGITLLTGGLSYLGGGGGGSALLGGLGGLGVAAGLFGQQAMNQWNGGQAKPIGTEAERAASGVIAPQMQNAMQNATQNATIGMAL